MKSSKKLNNNVSLSLKELCSIIKYCRKNNVQSLRYHDLEINLANDGTNQIPSAKSSALTTVQIEQDKEDAKDQALEDQLEYLKVNDPQAYEEMQLRAMNG